MHLFPMAARLASARHSLPRGSVIAFWATLCWLLLSLLWGFASPVFAQDAALVSAEPSVTQQIVAAVLPALGLVITALLTWATNELRRRTGIVVEANHRAALQSALMNGILFALQKSGWVAGQPVTSAMMEVARGYVETSVPDALRQFGIDPRDPHGRAMLDRLLTPKLPVATGVVTPSGDVLLGRAT